MGVIGARFSMSRNLVYLPFFVLGFYLTEERLAAFLKHRLRLAAAAVMALVPVSYTHLDVYKRQLQP